jgi:hypothetical protein
MHTHSLSHACRYLAEAPESHGEEFRQALSFMLRIGLGSQPAGSAAPQQQEATSVQLLLPGLLLATSTSSHQAAQMKRALVNKGAISVLAAFLEGQVGGERDVLEERDAVVGKRKVARGGGGSERAIAKGEV